MQNTTLRLIYIMMKTWHHGYSIRDFSSPATVACNLRINDSVNVSLYTFDAVSYIGYEVFEFNTKSMALNVCKIYTQFVFINHLLDDGKNQ